MTIIYVGRLIYSKGVADLLRAFRNLQGDLKLLIIGDGPERRNLEEVTGGRVEFLGEKSSQEVTKLLKDCDIFVNPSYTEGLPTSVIEAALCGKAIVATDVGGTSEIIQHEASALLVPPRDIAALTEALQRLIDDSALRERLGKAALARNKDRWGWEKSIEEYEKIFASLL